MVGRSSVLWYLWRRLLLNYKKVLLGTTAFYVIVVLPIVYDYKYMRHPRCDLPPVANNIEDLFLDIAAVETSVEPYLVPNYVHFYRFGEAAKRLNVIDVLCLLAAYRNQEPEKIFIHTDDVEATARSFSEYSYGRKLLAEQGFSDILHFHQYPQPEHVFGVPFSVKYREWHIGDLARLRILRRYGGIFLDNDAYLYGNLNDLRKHELSSATTDEGLDNTVIVAHRDSRFLSAWITSYMKYDPATSRHHRSEVFVNLTENFDPRPYLVRNGVIDSDVGKFFKDEITEMKTGALVVNLNVHPRDEVPKLDFISEINLYGPDFIDRYFRLDEKSRRRVNSLNRHLFENLAP